MKLKLLDNRHFKIISHKGIRKILFIGDIDTGKTTLVRDIARFYIFHSEDVSIIDCDVGQSYIGPPTTISFIRLKKRVYNFFPFPDKFYFTGGISPSFNIPAFITGVEKMSAISEKEKGRVLIDTTGYIRDKTAIDIKIHKIEIFSPDLVIFLEKKNELFPLKNFLRFSKIKFLTVKIPENLPSKTMEKRTENRLLKFQRYFRRKEIIRVNLNNVSIKFINFRESPFSLNLHGSLVSLRDRNLEDRMIGIISKKAGDFLEIMCPSVKFDFEIKGICFSNFFVDFEKIFFTGDLC